MLSMIPPMIAMTILMGAVIMSSSAPSELLRPGLLAANMTLHHERSFPPSGSAPACGPVTTDISPYRELVDWASVLVKDSSGDGWLITYPTNLPAIGGKFKTEEMASVSLALNRLRLSEFRSSVWDANSLQPAAGLGAVFAVSSLAIDDGAPILMTKVDCI